VVCLDSAGLGALVHAVTSARHLAARIVLVRVSGRNRDLLTTNLAAVFEVFDSTAAAERSLVRSDAAAAGPRW